MAASGRVRSPRFDELARATPAGDPGAAVGLSSAIEMHSGGGAAGGHLALLALLRGSQNAAVPSAARGTCSRAAPARAPRALRGGMASRSRRTDRNAARGDPMGAGPWPRLQRAGEQAGTRRERHAGWPVTRGGRAAADARRAGPRPRLLRRVRARLRQTTCPRGTSRLFERTRPFASIGGLTGGTLGGAYAPATSRKQVKVPEDLGTGDPRGRRGHRVEPARAERELRTASSRRNVPTSVCVIFALSAARWWEPGGPR